jgi:hypothetical protein
MPFLPTIGDSVIANTPNLVPKEYNKTVFTLEVSHGAANTAGTRGWPAEATPTTTTHTRAPKHSEKFLIHVDISIA